MEYMTPLLYRNTFNTLSFLYKKSAVEEEFDLFRIKDVLDSFRDIKICTSYKINNQIVKDYPSNISNYHVIPIYETLKGWEEKTKGISKFEKLPLDAQNFVKKIETLVNCNIDIISTGPERDENIIINKVFG